MTEETFLDCPEYTQGLCRSCNLLPIAYENQLLSKQFDLVNKLSSHIDTNTEILPPHSSNIKGFRYKAKMVVSGEVQRVIFGLQNEQGEGIDLTNCALYTKEIISSFAALKAFVLKVGLVPYNIPKKKGRLKYILITQTYSTNELMIRFVLNDEIKVERMKEHLAELFDALPNLKVVSANIQPIHQAILEGEKEIVLTEEKALREVLNEVPLYINPKSFFQTHPELAQKLYLQASQMAVAIKPQRVWDLFCGVGGFGLTILNELKKENIKSHLNGIEIEPNAITSAMRTAKELQLNDISFSALDSTLFAENISKAELPDLLVVNPPRRGVGKSLIQMINLSKIPHVIYSSCNIDSLKEDLSLLPNYTIQIIQLFDFFPHTKHFEVIVRLKHRD
ncbi:23S rRNA (uracil(747)-C(5))-methyltransferase RlmC [Thorsellia kenyensis]|uniref:23S rRNA (uracil(747)-C(5))-methyltransferase RlmC n=1 Tax=Thorsellia kenyensis TaxID=1549888 RepID=A0ABV6CFD4_9GAMM